MLKLTKAEAKKMGFGDPPLAKDYCNKPIHDTIGGKTCDFRSKGEWRLAKVFQFLKEAKEIKDWFYESWTFTFPDDTWLVDFEIIDKNGREHFVEFKGLFEADTRRKLQLLNKYRPEVEIIMCFYSKRDAYKMKTSKKYVSQVWVLTKNSYKTIFDKKISNSWLV